MRGFGGRNKYLEIMKTINIYNIEEHPNRNKCFEWIKNNWHDLNEHSVNELIESIKVLSEKIGGTFDYSISQVSDRNEYITFKGYNKEELNALNAEECPLTGIYYDNYLIEELRKNNFTEVFDILHEETEQIYSDDGLMDLCNSNDYYFLNDGTFCYETQDYYKV